MGPEREAIGIREAAAFLGAHEQTVRRLARRGAIPAFKVGKDWRFHREALVRWSRSHAGSRRFSVLIVDDDELVCRMLARWVERLGCQAWVAQSGDLGLERVRDETPGLILLDLRMPDKNGPQFLAELRGTHPTLPVVIVTAYPDSELMVEASRFAPVMLLTKPVAEELLARTVLAIAGDARRSAATGGGW